MYACHSSTAKRPPQHHAQKNFLHFLPDHALKIFFHFLPVCNISSKIAFPAAAQRQIATQKNGGSATHSRGKIYFVKTLFDGE
jgi:hypothetical protein